MECQDVDREIVRADLAHKSQETIVVRCDSSAQEIERSMGKPSLPIVFVNNVFGSSTSNVPPAACAAPLSSDVSADDAPLPSSSQRLGEQQQEEGADDARNVWMNVNSTATTTVTTTVSSGSIAAVRGGVGDVDFPSLWSTGDLGHQHLFLSSPSNGPLAGIAATTAAPAASPSTADAPLAVSWTALNASKALAGPPTTTTASVRSDETEEGSTIGRPPMASLPAIFPQHVPSIGSSANGVVVTTDEDSRD